MADLVVILILLAAVIPAVCYLVKAKKNGQACIGCPNASGCGGKCCCEGSGKAPDEKKK